MRDENGAGQLFKQRVINAGVELYGRRRHCHLRVLEGAGTELNQSSLIP